MSNLYTTALFACCMAGVAAEGLSLLFPSRILDLINRRPEEVAISNFLRLLALLSVAYVTAIALLLFSGDNIFRAYGGLLLTLSVGMWFFRKYLRGLRHIMAAESAVCLIVLLDVVRTLMR